MARSFLIEPKAIVAMASEHSKGTLASQNHQIPKAHSGFARDGLRSTVLGVSGS